MNQRLIDEIQIELNSMSIIVNDVEELLVIVGNSQPNNIHKTALGGFASQFYNGVENILKRIHVNFQVGLPKGEDWHLVLIDRFSSNSKAAFPVRFSPELIDGLTNYRRFRHYFFHGYSHYLNWDILKSGVEDIRQVFNLLYKELMNFGLIRK